MFHDSWKDDINLQTKAFFLGPKAAVASILLTYGI